jgi:microcompartment protein CcmK/EutM
MILARVAGRLTSTIHHPAMTGHTILILDRLKLDGTPSGSSIIALDTVGAGAGETVLVLDEGNGARQILGDLLAPVRSIVVGIVDEVERSGGGRAGPRPRP